MRAVAFWGLFSSLGAAVVLVCGFTLAATRQPAISDSWHHTISALAAPTAADRWIMTGALYALGVCHVATAWALRLAAPAGRVVLALGGVATLGVATFPTGAASTPTAHVGAASLAFGLLTLWPLFARRSQAAGVLSPGVCVAATAVLSALVLAFVVELVRGGPHVGLAERVAATSQALWPLYVVVSLRRRRLVKPYDA